MACADHGHPRTDVALSPMRAIDPQRHWEQIWERGGATRGSWYQDEPAPSLAALDAARAGPHASLIDVGGGASSLVDRLLDRGWRDLTVLDISATSLAEARQRLADRASEVQWIERDLLTWQPARRYEVWHDRALFHFLAAPTDRTRYLEVLAQALAPRGLVIVATFAEDGPTECSGLSVRRYAAPDLADALGPQFDVVASTRELHTTPAGATQPFTWVTLRRKG